MAPGLRQLRGTARRGRRSPVGSGHVTRSRTGHSLLFDFTNGDIPQAPTVLLQNSILGSTGERTDDEYWEAPAVVQYQLDDALELLAALEDARDVLIDTDHLAVVAQVEHEVQILSNKLGFGQGGKDGR